VAHHEKRDPGGRIGQPRLIGRIIELSGDVLVIEARQPPGFALRQLAAQIGGWRNDLGWWERDLASQQGL
jgi:hypothetical protein